MDSPLTFRSPKPAVTFWGAAQAVTGSMHLVEAAGRSILLDCGLVRGPHHETRSRSLSFPFPPSSVDAVVLSHAHIDHCGNLPNLVRQGFSGPIYCTPATRDLMALMLADSARIQEEDAFVRGVLDAPGYTGVVPAWSRGDVKRALLQCQTMAYGESREICPDIQVRLVDAGHLLGSAMVSLTIAGVGRETTITFTGDLGRRQSSLLPPPAPVPEGDLIISESTNGGRTLDSLARAAEGLEALVLRSVDQGGKVLIPAFSLGRIQMVVHYLQEAVRGGRLPEVPIYVDSPLAADIGDVYHRHLNSLNGSNGTVRYVQSHEESKELSHQRQPCIILAPSGMCDGGRIVGHLKHAIDDPRCTVVLVSYQAPHTLGSRLLQPGPRVRFHGRHWNRWAEVVELSGFSGHADHDELLAFLSPLGGGARKVRLVHGGLEQAEHLSRALEERGFADLGVPGPGEKVYLE